MRKTLLFLLAASAAAPAFAAADADDRSARRDAARAARAEARAERQAEQPQQSQRSEPRTQPRAVESGGGEPSAMREQRAPMIRQQVLERRPDRNPGADSVRPILEQRAIERRPERNLDADSSRPALERRREAVDSVREWRARERRVGDSPAASEQRQGAFREVLAPPREPRAGRDSIGNRRAPVISRVPTEGTQPPPPVAARPSSLTARHWRGDWRSDDRYDWRKHRNRHRSLFRFGFYYDPFGWSYRPFSIGWRMWPSYYQSSYWLNDPGMYRLPYAPPGYRWIRYYNDAVLVDTWDGQVVDIIYDFFW